MSHIVQLISKFILLSAMVLLTACATADKLEQAPEETKLVKQRVFYTPFDQVWQAAHAVIKYTIATDNPDTGTIETEYIKAVEGWRPPEASKAPSAGLRYKIVFIIAKGKSDGRDSTRVTIEKKMERHRDFFSETESVESDGLEEKVLFYRLEREIIVQQALKKVN